MEKNQIKTNTNQTTHKPFAENSVGNKTISETSVKNVFTATDLWFMQKTIRTAAARRRVYFN